MLRSIYDIYEFHSRELIALACGIFVVIYLLRRSNPRKVRSYFKDKTVLITGASLGLGRAIAQELYLSGSQVILCARNQADLEKVKKEFQSLLSGKEPEILCLDVSSSQDVLQESVEKIIKKFKRVDILINNAGNNHRGEIFEASDEMVKKMMNVNLWGPIRLIQALTRHMLDDNQKCDQQNVARNEYTFVNIGSLQSYFALPHRAAFGASKHAFLAFSDSLRAELFQHPNMNVLTVQPGYIDVKVGSYVLDNQGKPSKTNACDHPDGYSPEYVAKEIMHAIVHRQKELIVARPHHRMVIWLRFFCPNLYFWAMKLRAKKRLFDK